jgi:leucyl aminopeptidase (aminopeptidase T)
METRFVELMSAADVAVRHCMLTKPGEEILVATDTRIGEYMGGEALVTALMGAITAAGGEAQLLMYTPRERPNAELTRLVAAAFRAADGIFSLPTMTAGHTTAAREAYTSGVRYIMMGAGTLYGQTDKVYRLMPRSKEELDRLGRTTTRLAEIFKAGRHVHFTTAKGTDLTLEIGKLWVYNNTGIARKGELEVLPPGLAGAGPTEGSTKGRLVVDASIAPLYEVLQEPVVLAIEGGRITTIEGGAQAMAWKRMIEELQDPAAYNIAEIGVGTHPRARLSGEPLEDERISGACHIGIGTNISFGGQVKAKWHVDANVLNATIEVDGRRIFEDGRILV